MAQPGDAAATETPAADAGGAAGTAASDDTADAGAASLDDMAALIAETPADDTEGGDVAAEGERPDADKPTDDADKPKDDAEGDKPKADERKDAKAETPEALRKGFAALARDRKKIQAREAAAEAKFQQAAAFEQKAVAFDNVVRRLHEDPIGLLREAGGDALINKALDGVIASEKSPAEREVEKLRREVEAERQRLAQQQTEQQVANWRAGIVREVQAKADQYDLVTSLGMEDAVIEAITQYHIKHKAVLPTDVAAAQVEKLLEQGLSKSKKFGARGAVKPADKATPSRKTGAGTTLSSVASGGQPEVPAELPDDDDARFAAVMRELRASGLVS